MAGLAGRGLPGDALPKPRLSMPCPLAECRERGLVQPLPPLGQTRTAVEAGGSQSALQKALVAMLSDCDRLPLVSKPSLLSPVPSLASFQLPLNVLMGVAELIPPECQGMLPDEFHEAKMAKLHQSVDFDWHAVMCDGKLATGLGFAAAEPCGPDEGQVGGAAPSNGLGHPLQGTHLPLLRSLALEREWWN